MVDPGEGEAPGSGSIEDGRDGKAGAECATKVIREIGSSGMFSLDARLDISDAEKLQYLCDSIGEGATLGD